MESTIAQAAPIVRGDTNVELVFGIVLFLAVGIIVPLAILVVGSFIRPRIPGLEKGEPYECGEPAIGPSWVQFDLRFYIVALFFIIFDVEIALLWPWAVVFGQGTQQTKIFALYDLLFFFGVLVVGFLYLWKFGYLDWVRATGGVAKDRKPAVQPGTSA